MASSAAQVDETTLSEENDVATVLHEVTVNLGLDVLNAGSVLLQPGDVDLDIKVTNVFGKPLAMIFKTNIMALTADDCVIGHLLKVFCTQDISASGGSDKDLANASSLLHSCNLVSGDSSLESVDRVDFGNNDTSSHSVKSHGTALTNITVTGNNRDLTSDHDISGTLDTIDQGLTATVQVVEFGLGDRVVNIDSWHKEGLVLQHLVQVVNTSGGLL